MPKGKKRKYLPYHLTKAEKRSPKLRRKLASCIRKVEKKACKGVRKKNGRYDYSECLANPVAVCRASISGTKTVKKVGKLGKVDVFKDEKGHKFIYVHEYGKKRRVRDYTKF